MFQIFMTLKMSLMGLLLLMATAQAQVNDPRVAQLQEQVRSLTGQVEELNFQLLQMQENLRRQQEDIEFRLQQLEDGQQQGSLQESNEPKTNVAEAQPIAPNAAATATEQVTVAAAEAAAGTTQRLGVPPRDLGSLTLNDNGDVMGTSIDFSAQRVEQSIDGTQVASVGGEMNAEELYRSGYGYVLDGDYKLAEDVFSTFVDTYPDDPLIADARFWLGESQLAQGRFEDAADTFIVARSLHPDARKGTETLYKIGHIMAALGNREVACVTFSDALNAPNMAPQLRQRIDQERAKAQC